MQDLDHSPAARGGLAFAMLASAAAIAVGIGLRLWNLRDQVLGGDELHAVGIALKHPLGWILTTYSLADYSIPLTAAIRLWLDAGGALSEIGLRVPGLVASAALVVLVAIAATRAFGAAAGARAAWLVAIAPALVLYGRIVRSYSPMLLCAIGAAIAAWRWIETRSARAALAYVVLAALATWFHLGAAPFVAAPLAFAAGLALTGKSTERDRPLSPRPAYRAIAATALGLALAVALFLAPAHLSLLNRARSLRQTAIPDLAAWIAVAKLQSGAPDSVLAAVAFALAALGLAWLARVRPRLAAYGATLVVAQIAGLLVLRPAYFEYSLILNRYLLPCLVVLCAWIALGLGALAPARPRVAALATALYCAALFARGPLAAPGFRLGSFAHANDAVSFADGVRLGVDATLAPRFYASLAAAGPAPIVEIPWHAWWQFSRLFSADQGLHHQRVLVSGAVPGLADPRIRFRNYVLPEPEPLARSGARWVVVHLDLESEQARIVGRPRDDSLPEVPDGTRRQMWNQLRVVARSAAAQLEAFWGPPDVEEDGLRAWKLPRR